MPMGTEQIVLVLVGALAGGIVNGLSGFGTAITALGIWLYVLPPTDASSLAIICSIVSQFQTLPMIWRSIRWDYALPLVIPGLVGVPIGTMLLPHIEPRLFKLGIGMFLVLYSAYVLTRRGTLKSDWGGRIADAVAGCAGGVLGGLTGLSGVPPVVWTDVRGWTKEQRRGVVQIFNVTILCFALASHAVTGLLTRQVAWDAAVALAGSIGGAWFGAYVYWRLADRSYQLAVMVLLMFSGATLIWTSL
jgi:hypothetical protein